MYLARFATLWLMVSRLSGFVLNYWRLVGMGEGSKPPPFEKIGERENHAAFSADAHARLWWVAVAGGAAMFALLSVLL